MEKNANLSHSFFFFKGILGLSFCAYELSFHIRNSTRVFDVFHNLVGKK